MHTRTNPDCKPAHLINKPNARGYSKKTCAGHAGERAKRKETEERYSKLRLEVLPSKVYFGNVKISKEDSFQLLYSASASSGTNTHNRVSPSDGLVWLGNMDSWLS